MQLELTATLTKLNGKPAKETGDFPQATVTLEAPMEAAEIGSLARFLQKGQQITVNFPHVQMQAELDAFTGKAEEEGSPTAVITLKGGISAEKVADLWRYLGFTLDVTLKRAQMSFEEMTLTEASNIQAEQIRASGVQARA